MRLKLLFIIGLVAGYIVGARAGRARYEQIKAAANDVWEDPRVQKAVAETQDFVKENAPIVAEKVTEGAKVAGEKVAETAKVAASSVAEGTRVAAASAKDAAGKVAETAKEVSEKVVGTAKSVTGRGSDSADSAGEPPVGTAASDWVEISDATTEESTELGAESLDADSPDAIWVDSTDPATAHETDIDGADVTTAARHAADDTDTDGPNRPA